MTLPWPIKIEFMHNGYLVVQLFTSVLLISKRSRDPSDGMLKWLNPRQQLIYLRITLSA